MVAIALAPRAEVVSQQKLELAFKEAFEFKRDQIARIQSRPPFDIAANRDANTAYARIYEHIARHGDPDLASSELVRMINAADLSQSERAMLIEFAARHQVKPRSKEDWDWLTVDLDQAQQEFFAKGMHAPLGRPAIATRLVQNVMENAGIAFSDENLSTVTAVVATAYRQACLRANEDLAFDTNSAFAHLPEAVERLVTSSASVGSTERSFDRPLPAATHATPENHLTVGVGGSPEQHGCAALINLPISEVCSLAIESKKGDSWGSSAQRNARVITDLFIAVNGDLRMSEIKRHHLNRLRDRLDILPRVWGKSREDRDGGLPAIFSRGEKLAEQWAKVASDTEQSDLPKIGLLPATFNRHFTTLKSLLHFVEELENEANQPTHVSPTVSFKGLSRADKRKPSTRRPVPTAEDVHKLLSTPIHTGCQNEHDRLTPGNVIIHDGAYWVPLLLSILLCRSNELCQCRLSDVITDVAQPYIHVRASTGRDLKTVFSDRKLPIPPKLVDLGFLDYVNALRNLDHVWLFPEYNTNNIRPNKRFKEDDFNSIFEFAFPNTAASSHNEKKFDTVSLRKFGLRRLRRARGIDIQFRKGIAGHKQSGTLESIYEDEFSPEELLPCAIELSVLLAHLRPSPLRLRHFE